MAGKEGKLKSPIRKYLLLCSTENNSNSPESKLSFHLLILTSADVQLCLVPGQVCLSALWNSAQLLPSRNGYPGTGAPQGGDAVCPELQGLLREYEEISQREMKLRAPNPVHGLAALVCPPMPVLCLAQDQVIHLLKNPSSFYLTPSLYSAAS